MSAHGPLLIAWTVVWSLLVVAAAMSLHWKRVVEYGKNPRPQARKHAAFGYDMLRHYVVLFGGKGERDENYNDTWIFDVLAGRWYAVHRSVTPPAMHGAAFGLNDGKFYLVGGCDQNRCFNDVWVFLTSTFEWHKLTPKGDLRPAGRLGAVGGFYATGSHIIFGLGSTIDHHYLEDIFFFDIPMQRWYKVIDRLFVYSPFVPHPRRYATSMMVSPSEVLIFGGCSKYGQCPTGDAWLFNVQSHTWQSLPLCASPRMEASAVTLLSTDEVEPKPTAILIYGGRRYSSQHLLGSAMIEPDEVVIYDLQQKTWSVRSSRCEDSSGLPEQRSAASTASALTEVYMFGGEAYDGRLLDDFWMLAGDWRESSSHQQCHSINFNLLALHGLLMSISFALILPAGALWALYKSARISNDEKTNGWRRVHAIAQICGTVIVAVGAACSVQAKWDNGKHLRSVHSILGAIVIVLLCLQVALGFSKRLIGSEHRKRIVDEAHFWMAIVVLPLALLNVILGLQLVVVPLAILFGFFVHISCLLAALGLILPVVRLRSPNIPPSPPHTAAALANR
uniref:Cytochrome b561 domain-containing protein n=1 Tax=Trichuris muris TaxID=70415 RepID=A0A5S6QYD9_TRIMR